MNVLVFEWTSVVSDDGLRKAIPENDVVKNELGYFLVGYVCQRDGFDPLRKIISGGDDEFVAIGRGRMDLSHEVECPLCEGPRRCNRPKFLCWCMNQVTVYLTLATHSDKFKCIFLNGWPITPKSRYIFG